MIEISFVEQVSRIVENLKKLSFLRIHHNFLFLPVFFIKHGPAAATKPQIWTRLNVLNFCEKRDFPI